MDVTYSPIQFITFRQNSVDLHMTRLKIFPIVLHLLGWLIFISLPMMFLTQGKSFLQLSPTAVFAYLVFVGVYVIFFYVNAYWIFPILFLKKRYFNYTLAILLMFLAIYLIKPFDTLMKTSENRGRPNQTTEGMPPPPEGQFSAPPDEKFNSPPNGNPKNRHFDITSFFILIMMIGLGSALQAIKQRQLYENRAILAETERSHAELSFLKAQINPHFLYNTLNNIYTLSITGSEDAPESILKLSNIMRYVTDEAEADFVSLQDEIECISNFIALQKLRLGKKVTLKYTVEGDVSGHKIAPLILMTFIENVFKYGLSNHIASVLEILITIKEKEITLFTKNQLFEHKKPQTRKGVGLENTKKRLQYLYPNQHKLNIEETDGHFTLFLVLDSK
jgi:two-component system LytT family sensor kinase